MNAKEFSAAMSDIDSRYIAEAIFYRKKPLCKAVLIKCGAAAACLAIAVTAMFPNLPDSLYQQIMTLCGHQTVSEKPGAAESSETSEFPISMDSIYLNEVREVENTSLKWFCDPNVYDCESREWDKESITEYYGRDLTPAYIPAGLTASPENDKALALSDKEGNVMMDTVCLSFYHDFDEDGNPKYTDNIPAYKGIFINVSKLGMLSDCIYQQPDNQLKSVDIGGISVILGYMAVPYGPYDSDTHAAAGYYDMYTAEFELDDIDYQVVSRQLELKEMVKVVSSIILNDHSIAVE